MLRRNDVIGRRQDDEVLVDVDLLPVPAIHVEGVGEGDGTRRNRWLANILIPMSVRSQTFEGHLLFTARLLWEVHERHPALVGRRVLAVEDFRAFGRVTTLPLDKVLIRRDVATRR